MSKAIHVCVVGLGYVGLPLTYHFSAADVGYVTGYDIDSYRINMLRHGADPTDMVPMEVILKENHHIQFVSSMPSKQDVYVICVPTPDNDGIPDYSYVDSAFASVLEVMREDSIIVIESTVGPSTVRDRLRPMLISKGYDPDKAIIAFSPERVNPGPTAFGDMVRCTKIVAVDAPLTHPSVVRLSGMYLNTFDKVALTPDTRVGEIAKCFENMQRDVNIAMLNELSMICRRANVDLDDVMECLHTKPTSPKFTSGLVGGHCIPVDPYYLATYYDDIAPSRLQIPIVGRKINEEFIEFVALETHRLCAPGKAILICGATYKPNVNDIRNSGSLKVGRLLRDMGHTVHVIDPLVQARVSFEPDTFFDVVIGAVPHKHKQVPWTDMALTIDCKFINIGGAFQPKELKSFQSIINM